MSAIELPISAASNPPAPDSKTSVIGQREWDAAVEDIKKNRPAMASYLEYGTPKAGEQGLTISFNPEYASIAALAKDRVPEIADYLRERFGREVRVNVVVDKSSVAPTATKQRMEAEDRKREMTDAAVAHPLIQRIQSELGANVVDIQLIENREHPNQ
jgi:hypothetical protein